MTQRTSRLFLDDILYAIEKIERYTNEMTFEALEKDELVVDAVLRNLEVIGEAAGNISDDLRDKYSHIPWKRIVGLRNIVIHTYFHVDLSIVWQIITVNLPATKNDIVVMRDSLIP